MCILIVQPAGEYVSRRHLKEAFRINSDGAGFMFNIPAELNKSGQDVVKIFKGWFGFRQFYKDLRNCERMFPASTFVIHMRIGTSGTKTADNCHPFKIASCAGFAHNGIMYGLGDKQRSDTREFVEDTLCKLPDHFWDDKPILDALNNCAINSSSKYVILLGDGAYIIFNEGLGHWHDGCWYSNSSYVLPTKKPVTVKQCIGNNKLTTPAIVLPGDIEKSTACGHIEGRCVMCMTPLTLSNIGFSRWSLKLCTPCLETMYGVVHVRCDTCLMSNVLTADLLFGRKDSCEFCHATISPDDVAWQLLATAEVE